MNGLCGTFLVPIEVVNVQLNEFYLDVDGQTLFRLVFILMKLLIKNLVLVEVWDTERHCNQLLFSKALSHLTIEKVQFHEEILSRIFERD